MPALKKLFLLAAVAIAILAAWQYVQAGLAWMNFTDDARQELKFAVGNKHTIDDVRRTLVELAKEQKFIVGPRDIHITRKRPAFYVEFDYSWPVNLWIYKHELKFHFSGEGEIYPNDRN